MVSRNEKKIGRAPNNGRRDRPNVALCPRYLIVIQRLTTRFFRAHARPRTPERRAKSGPKPCFGALRAPKQGLGPDLARRSGARGRGNRCHQTLDTYLFFFFGGKKFILHIHLISIVEHIQKGQYTDKTNKNTQRQIHFIFEEFVQLHLAGLAIFPLLLFQEVCEVSFEFVLLTFWHGEHLDRQVVA